MKPIRRYTAAALAALMLSGSLTLGGCSYFDAILIHEGPAEESGGMHTEITQYQPNDSDHLLSGPDVPGAECTLILQDEHEDDLGNLVQIPMFSANYESVAVSVLNETISDELLRIRNEYLTLGGYDSDNARIHMGCYVDTEGTTMQAVVHYYKTNMLSSGDGYVYSYVYDRADDRIVTISEAMQKIGLTQADIRTRLEQYILELYGVDEEGKANAYLTSCELAAFRLLGEGAAIYVYASTTYNRKTTESVYSFVGDSTGKVRMLPCFVYDPTNVESLPPQSKLTNDSGTLNAYKDTVYGIGCTFPVVFQVERFYEPGYAVFSDTDHTMTLTYFIEDGANLEEISSYYSDALSQTTGDMLCIRRDSEGFSELIFVSQTASTEAEDTRTAWIVLRCPISRAADFDFSSVTLTVNTVRGTGEEPVITRTTDAQIRAGLEGILSGTDPSVTVPLSIHGTAWQMPSEAYQILSYDPEQVTFHFRSFGGAVARVGTQGRVLPLREGTCDVALVASYDDATWSRITTVTVSVPESLGNVR